MSDPLSPASMNTNIDSSLVFNSPRFVEKITKNRSIDKQKPAKKQETSKSTRNSSKNDDLDKSNTFYYQSKRLKPTKSFTKSDNEFSLETEKCQQSLTQKPYNNFIDDKKIAGSCYRM